jgi:hypothetical protein
MIRVLMWKEYREHRAIWLALALVGGGGLYGLSRLMEPVWGLSYNGSRESLQAVAVLFAWTYGLVCGAMLLANESESGTLIFLDMLPVRRIELWLVKSLFGLLLLLAQLAVLTGFVIGLGIVETSGQLLATLLAMLFFGLFALSWSLLFSARGENVLNVIGLAIVGQIAGVLAATILLMPVAVVLETIWRDGDAGSKFLLLSLGALGLTVGPLFGSARLFSRLDRLRQPRARLSAAPPATASSSAIWSRMLWLSYVQMRRLLVGVLLFALVLGLLLPVIGPPAWPSLTLILGVLCGVTIWADEQLHASFRFLGDQRLPLGRVWIVKVGMRLVLAVLAVIVLLLPSLILAVVHRLGSNSPTEQRIPFFADLLHSNLVGTVVPTGTHLSMWLLYGFAVGHLCGLLFRKSLVAAVVSLGVAGMLVSLWLPSLLGIGLHFWQVAGVPLLLMAASWLLMPAWAADRLLARGTFVRLGSVLLAAGLWTVGALWYRVAEIPDVPDQFDMPAFTASIPSLNKEQNAAGLEIRAAWSEVDHLTSETMNKPKGKPLFADLRANGENTLFIQILTVLDRGWPKHAAQSELSDWLDAKFKQEWYGHVEAAANHPVGVVEDVKLITFDSRTRSWGNVAFLNEILAVRGLQRQTRGDPRTFVDHLRISLALSRNVQHRAPPDVARAGRRAEPIVVAALDRWLEKLSAHPELLERVRDILLEHEAQLPNDTDAVKAACLIAQNSLEFVPDKLVDSEIGRHPLGSLEIRQAEIDLTALLWRIPWERERHQRIVRVVFQGDPRQQRQAEEWGGSALASLALRVRIPPRGKRDLALLHAAQLKAALRLYQAKQGKLPATLQELVPVYLPAIPADPFDGKPFRYRVSQGEKLGWFDDAPPPAQPGPRPPLGVPGPPPGMGGGPPGQFGEMAAGGIPPPPPPPVKFVPAGQAILWSVGEDERDDGGKQQGLRASATSFGEDLIYLLPPPG